MVAYEIFGYFSPLKSVDHAAHIAGVVVGLISAEWWKRNLEASGESRKRNLRWYELLLGKQ